MDPEKEYYTSDELKDQLLKYAKSKHDSLPVHKRILYSIRNIPYRISLRRRYRAALSRRYNAYSLRVMWERATRGFSEYDTYAVDAYLVWIIPAMIRELSFRDTGAPGVIRDTRGRIIAEVNYEADELGAFIPENIEEVMVKWNEVLTDIAQGFDAARELMDGWFDIKGQLHYADPGSPEWEERLRKFRRGIDLVKYNFFSLWD